MKYFTPDEIEAARAALPGHWLIEVELGTCSALIAVPATEANANRVLAGSPGVTPDMLDGLTVRRRPIEGGPDEAEQHRQADRASA